MNNTERHPWSYASSKRIAEAWSEFGAEQFPNYERFWQLFIASRTKRGWGMTFLPDVPLLDRKVSRLNQRIFVRLYNVPYRLDKPRPKSLTPVQLDRLQRWDFIAALRGMSYLRENIELFLFLALFATKALPESHSVYQAYLQRIAEHKAAVEAANAPFKNRPLSLDEISSIPHVPLTAILPEEIAVVTEYYDLASYTQRIDYIRTLEEEVEALPSFHNKLWLPYYELTSPEVAAKYNAEREAAMRADEPALQHLLTREGYDTMHDLATELAANLTAELNRIWGGQVVPLAEKLAEMTQNKPVQTV